VHILEMKISFKYFINASLISEMFLNYISHLLILLTCLSLCNTQARAVNLIHSILCDDEGGTQTRGC